MVPTETLPHSTTAPQRLIASPWHTLFVIALGALNAYRGAIQAAQVRSGFGPNRPYLYLRTIFFELAFLAIVLGGVWLRGVSLTTIIGPRWRSAGQVFRDLGLGVTLLFLSLFVGSLFGGHQRGAPPDPVIAYLIPGTSLELLIWIALSTIAGICEEAVYRGYFRLQFTALTGSVPAGILISAAAFGAAHAYQGLQRAFVIGVSAVVFGVFAQWLGTVRPGMFAHTLQDAIAPLLIKSLRR